MRLVLLTLCALTAGCTDFPEFDGSQSPGVASAPWPELVPLAGIVAAQPPARTDPAIAGELEGRAAALRRRAAGLQGEVVDPDARRRMDGGVTLPETPGT